MVREPRGECMYDDGVFSFTSIAKFTKYIFLPVSSFPIYIHFCIYTLFVLFWHKCFSIHYTPPPLEIISLSIWLLLRYHNYISCYVDSYEFLIKIPESYNRLFVCMVMLCIIALSYYFMLHLITLLLYYIILHVMLCYVMLCYSMLYYMLCYVIVCYITCYVMLC